MSWWQIGNLGFALLMLFFLWDGKGRHTSSDRTWLILVGGLNLMAAVGMLG